MQGSGLRVQISECSVLGVGFRVWSLGFEVEGSYLRFQGVGFRVEGRAGFRVQPYWKRRQGLVLIPTGDAPSTLQDM